ncbi:hypothetical protein [Pedobacter rhizosphaerae]|uniref:Uncharacterized protein n=1 Tax=Pedobacter rhizosphaerae TaxID=390241 RepID=A0A1H9KHJ6_9SPHI|nr:hypothetical protein [Pedobacter rhizosphaerae]SEQ98539.1 hypothetical protein SAMN04488023_1033 [Pedobacter rhizosphaerae]
MDLIRRKIIWINILVFIITIIEVSWFSPDGLSAVDLSSSVLDYVLWIGMFALVLINILLLIFNFFQARLLIKTSTMTLLMISYWLLINYSEFQERVAAWSTFSSREIFYYTVCYSVWPAGLSACLLFAGLYSIERFLKAPGSY